MQTDLKNHQKRARFVQGKVSEAKKRHVKVDHVVEMLAEQLFVSRATIYRDMRFNFDNQLRSNR